MAILVLLNNFLHDFSAAGWLFCTVLLWVMFREGKGFEILGTIRLMMQVSFGGIVIFGIIRALAYRQYEWSAAAGEGQVILLIVKHVLLTVVFILGVVYYIRAGKVLKSENKLDT